ncbi:hypothetical protein [Thermodesulfovibrio hydrogeniphilus]
MKKLNEKEMEKICFYCNHFFFDKSKKETEYGICLLDEEFDPFIEEILEKADKASCRDLIERKKFKCDREACEKFEPAEIIYIDDNTPIARALEKFLKRKKREISDFEFLLYDEIMAEEKKRKVDDLIEKLESSNEEDRNSAIKKLGKLTHLGNNHAFRALSNYLRKLPPPQNIQETHLKIQILEYLKPHKKSSKILPILIDELYKTPSNNTTRQWLNAIFDFMKRLPKEEIQLPLQRMLNDKRFSNKLKNKMMSVWEYVCKRDE